MSSTATKQTNIHQLDKGKWLYDLLSDVREDVAKQPTDEAIGRIRARLQREMTGRPERAAA